MKNKKSNKTKAQAERPAGSRSAVVGDASIPGIASVVLVCALVCLQGGFYPGAVCIVGLIGTAAFLAWDVVRTIGKRKGRRGLLESACLALVALFYLVSGISHGLSTTILLETCSWFAVAGLALWCSFSSRARKRWVLRALGLAGAAFAIVGILMTVGAFSAEGGMSNGRLMFTFQYANAAGLFFAVSTILCLLELPGRWRILAAFPAIALVMTQSIGAIAVLVLGFAVVLASRIQQDGMTRDVAIGATLAVAACIAAAAFLSARIAEAAQTFIERIIQIIDALSLLASNWMFGVGPDQWGLVYPLVQSAQYRAATVHCSYAQVALDAGIPVSILLAVMVVAGIVRLVRRGEKTSALCAGMIALHACVDFDFQFASILLLLAVLMAGCANEQSDNASSARSDTLKMACTWALAAICLIGSGAGAYCYARAAELTHAYSQADAKRALELSQDHPLLQRDKLLEAQVAGACYAAGDYVAAIQVTDDTEALAESSVIYRTYSLRAVHRDAEACDFMGTALRGRPYDEELFRIMRGYITQTDAGADFVEAFNCAADFANEQLEHGHAPWLSNQQRIDPIEK